MFAFQSESWIHYNHFKSKMQMFFLKNVKKIKTTLKKLKQHSILSYK
jgi:hypothetical protein